MHSLPLVGISSCLLGNRVRYDGNDKFNPLVATYLAPYLQWLPLCPESMAGLGIPRPPVHLVNREGEIRALGRDDERLDVTDPLVSIGRIVAQTYPELCGFVVQSRSPSCGFGTTPIKTAATPDAETNPTLGSGLFIERIHQQYPDLPIINESELTAESAALFLDRVRRYHASINR